MVLAPAVLIVHIDMYVKSTTGGCDVVVMSEFCSVCFVCVCVVGGVGVGRVWCPHSDLGMVGCTRPFWVEEGKALGLSLGETQCLWP